MVSNKTEYILKILINLAQRECSEFISSRVVADEEGVPPKFMPQLMSSLVKRGWVESVRGINGGVRLVADPHKLSVLDVIELAEDPFLVKKCATGICSFQKQDTCNLLPLWRKAQKNLEEVMGSMSIADLI